MKATDWKVGVSSCSWVEPKEDELMGREMFEAYKQGGIDCMEISPNPYKYNLIDFNKIYKLAKEYGIELWSFHLTYTPYYHNDISGLTKEIRDNTVAMQSEYIKKASDIGIKNFVIHPSSEPNKDEERGIRIEYAKESLSRLADVAEKYGGGVIAVEDIPRTCLGNCSNEILRMIEHDDRLRVCFDTNHLLIEDNVEFIKKVGKKIITLHVSDYDFLNEQHWLPYEGENDWVAIVSALEEVGYSGPFMYELGLKPRDTIIRRDLTYADFRNNYLALVNKTKPEILGKQIKEKVDARAFFKTKQF